MIITQNGDLLAVPEGHIVHGCNARGVMGSGVAKLIRDKWPNVYTAYRKEYEAGSLLTGTVMPVKVSDDLVIWNAVTQSYYNARYVSSDNNNTRYVSYDAIAQCFERINELALKMFLDVKPMLHFPLIGADRGGGNWEIISTIIDEEVDDRFDKVLWLYK